MAVEISPRMKGRTPPDFREQSSIPSPTPAIAAVITHLAT